jgi:hypothetical protein
MNTKPETRTADTPPPDREAPVDRLPRALFVTALMLLVHLIAAVLFVLCMSYVVANLTDIFANRDVEVCSAAIMVIDVSILTIKYWYLIILAVIVFDGAVLFLLQLLPPRLAIVRRLWFGLFPVAILLGMGLVVWVLASELISIKVFFP